MICYLKEGQDRLPGQDKLQCFLAKKLTTRSLPEIGRRFSNRDHTTVIHAVKTITKLSEKDEEMKKNLVQIKSLLLEN